MLRIVQANFVAPTPKKAVTINLGSGLSVLPGSIFNPSNAFIHHLECIHASMNPCIFSARHREVSSAEEAHHPVRVRGVGRLQVRVALSQLTYIHT